MSFQVRIHQQQYRGQSPWPISLRIKSQVWEIVYYLFFRITPKPLNSIRLILLRLFGASIEKGVFVHSRARFYHPWNISIGTNSAIGDGAVLYALDKIVIGKEVTIAQEAYLCGGTHDFSSDILSLVTAQIKIEDNVFVGARAFILPGIEIASRSIVGACSVVTKDVAKGRKVAGNPARLIG